VLCPRPLGKEHSALSRESSCHRHTPKLVVGANVSTDTSVDNSNDTREGDGGMPEHVSLLGDDSIAPLGLWGHVKLSAPSGFHLAALYLGQTWVTGIRDLGTILYLPSKGRRRRRKRKARPKSATLTVMFLSSRKLAGFKSRWRIGGFCFDREKNKQKNEDREQEKQGGEEERSVRAMQWSQFVANATSRAICIRWKNVSGVFQERSDLTESTNKGRARVLEEEPGR